MQADIALHLGGRALTKRRCGIRDRDQLDISLMQHDAPIGRSGRYRLRLPVNHMAVLGIGRLHKTEPVKLLMCYRHIRYKMRHMIEKDFLSDRQLPHMFHIPFLPDLFPMLQRHYAEKSMH